MFRLCLRFLFKVYQLQLLLNYFLNCLWFRYFIVKFLRKIHLRVKFLVWCNQKVFYLIVKFRLVYTPRYYYTNIRTYNLLNFFYQQLLCFFVFLLVFLLHKHLNTLFQSFQKISNLRPASEIHDSVRYSQNKLVLILLNINKYLPTLYLLNKMLALRRLFQILVNYLLHFIVLVSISLYLPLSVNYRQNLLCFLLKNRIWLTWKN